MPNPTLNTYNCNNTNGNNNKYQEKTPCVNIITISNAPKENAQSINPLVTFDTTKIYFGKYVFLIKDALPTIALND